MNQLINEAEVVRTWAPMIEEATGISDKGKLNWMSKYCHFHQLNENVYNQVHLNPNANVYGMGAVSFPGDPTTTTGFNAQATGSGDRPFSLLPLAMQVAAQTVGLDLVPVVPMSGPLGILTYLDFIYAGGRLDSTEPPLMVKVNTTTATFGSSLTNATAWTANVAYYLCTSAGTPYYALTFVGLSRIDGFPIFKVNAYTSGAIQPNGTAGTVTLAAAAVANATISTNTNGTGDIITFTEASTLELVKALEDHIPAFSGSGFAPSTVTGGNDVSNVEPYLRGDGELTEDNLMGLSLFNKSVAAETYQVAAAVTREQVQDLKQFGIDAVAQVEAVLVNELTQSINKLILQRIFRLGTSNAYNVYSIDSTNLNLYVAASGSASISLGTDANGVSRSITTSASVPTSGDNGGTLQRKILSKILAASNLIAIRGRRGAANFAVTNGQLATAIQDIAGFTPYPMANTVNQNGGSRYPVGSIAGVTIYVDPNMSWTDTRIAVGRKGDGNSPGLVFMPYLMAESAQTIAEMTMAPKIAVKSRFTLVDAGFHPETMYFTLGVSFSGYSIV